MRKNMRHFLDKAGQDIQTSKFPEILIELDDIDKIEKLIRRDHISVPLLGALRGRRRTGETGTESAMRRGRGKTSGSGGAGGLHRHRRHRRLMALNQALNRKGKRSSMSSRKAAQ